jgi:hypothetical protein
MNSTAAHLQRRARHLPANGRKLLPASPWRPVHRPTGGTVPARHSQKRERSLGLLPQTASPHVAHPAGPPLGLNRIKETLQANFLEPRCGQKIPNRFHVSVLLRQYAGNPTQTTSIQAEIYCLPLLDDRLIERWLSERGRLNLRNVKCSGDTPLQLQLVSEQV